MASTGFGTLSVFGIEKRRIKAGANESGFGTLSVFGIEKRNDMVTEKLISFGTLSVFGIEKHEFGLSQYRLSFGDTIEFKDGHVYRNVEHLEEDYIKEAMDSSEEVEALPVEIDAFF